MKCFFLFFIQLLCLSFIQAQEVMSLGELKRLVRNEKRIDLFEIEGNQTYDSLQKSSEQYIDHYRVTRGYHLNRRKTSGSKKFLMDSLIIDSSSMKTCPFVPYYVVELNESKKTYIFFSLEPCSKIMIVAGNKEQYNDVKNIGELINYFKSYNKPK